MMVKENRGPILIIMDEAQKTWIEEARFQYNVWYKIITTKEIEFKGMKQNLILWTNKKERNKSKLISQNMKVRLT